MYKAYVIQKGGVNFFIDCNLQDLHTKDEQGFKDSLKNPVTYIREFYNKCAGEIKYVGIKDVE